MAATAVILAALILPPALIHGAVHRRVGTLRPASLADQPQNLPHLNTGKFETDVNAPALNDQNDRSIKLDPAPDSRVTEDTNDGSLPRVGEDGMRPWQVYARPFNTADKRPRIALVITDLGLSRLITDQAIGQLPPPVTLSFDAQGPVVAAWGTRARQDGHEILLQLPMEPFDFPQSDPGPNTLLLHLPSSDNLARLNKVMARMSGYIGVTTAVDSSFALDQDKFMPVLQVLHDRGLMILDARVASHSPVTDMAHGKGIPAAAATERLDTDLAPEAIAAALDDLEKTARQEGYAIGITTATPVMLDQLQIWLKDLPQRGIALAPLSAMVQ